MSNLETELKALIISALELEDVTVDDIDTQAPLFGEGLGLDSIDALELGLAIQKRYQVKIDANASDTKSHFASVATLANFIRSQEAA
ncbi:MAG: phosphopantetheine-binding protein [Pseudomonadota bacterium]|uniref:phosphopantetheine-binding protein n=1 Tax=Gammaproteobacteria TaxID=1236 RepID=UPI00067F356B|nr:phosphopantetheine-binding protein [Gallaecimonas pentaromativorans]MED5525565.1 phosphopantetheine-binding protein [Pseudomonadota bacterium]